MTLRSFEYQETPVGQLPVGWSIRELGNIVSMQLGRTPARDEPQWWTDGVIPWVSIKDLNNGLVRDTAEKVSQQAYDEFMHSKVVPAGTLLFSFKLTIGKLGILGVDAAHNEAIASLFPDQSVAIRDYLFYLFMAYDFDTFLDAYVKGSTLNKRKLQQLPIPIPPLPEQRRIAAVLNAIQDAIAAQEDVIAAARHFKRSLMQRLFTYGPGREPAETKETEIGEIPVHWQVVELGSLCEGNGGAIQTGPFGSQLHSADYVEHGVPTVMPQDMVDNRISVANIARITEADHERLSKYHLRVGDIVYARRGDIGRRALVTEVENDWLCGTGSLFIRPSNPEISPAYLFHFLGKTEVIDHITNRAVGSTMLNLNTRIMSAVPIAYPVRDEQEFVVEALEATDAKIAAEEDRKTALDALFKSTLHQLMTGQIRLLSDEGLPLPKN